MIEAWERFPWRQCQIAIAVERELFIYICVVGSVIIIQFSARAIVPALRPGTRYDPFGGSVRGRKVGGVRQGDPYQGNLIGGVRARAENDMNCRICFWRGRPCLPCDLVRAVIPSGGASEVTWREAYASGTPARGTGQGEWEPTPKENPKSVCVCVCVCLSTNLHRHSVL